MKTLTFLLVLTILSCGAPKNVYTKEQKHYAGKVIDYTYLKGAVGYVTTFVRTDSLDLQVEGKIRGDKDGKKCYILEKDGGRELYFLIEGSEKEYKINE
jgi:hypothetical protein